MYARLPKYVPLFLVSALAVTACDENSTAGLTGPSRFEAAVVTAEPTIVIPEFFPSPFCVRFSPFGVRLAIILLPSRDLVLDAVRFHFVDRFGGRVVPIATLLPIPRSSPVPIPSSPTIPIPRPSSFRPILIPSGTSQTVPFFLQFDCGVPANGTVFVNLQMIDRDGTSDTSELRVQVRE